MTPDDTTCEVYDNADIGHPHLCSRENEESHLNAVGYVWMDTLPHAADVRWWDVANGEGWSPTMTAGIFQHELQAGNPDLFQLIVKWIVARY